MTGVRELSKTEPRRLAAVMFTDMVGYTSLAQRDEPSALELLKSHRMMLRACLHKHGGREVKTIGDAFLVEFPSALEAVKCGLSIQQAVDDWNRDKPLKKRLAIRIGVHLGDVVHSKSDIYGDAVNIASRIEPLARPGEVLITQQVYDHVRNKLDKPIGYLGKRDLKNVEMPVDVYKVVTGLSHTGPVIATASSIQRIAVLPFASISPDTADEYFADGLTEELISLVSRIGGLRVISRTSAMKYKGTKKAMGEIAQELNVGKVLEGSVRKASDKLRITVQLIDVQKDENLWSETYDRELKDVFDIQSDIARKVVGALQMHLHAEEERQIEKKPTENIEAYSMYLKGLHYRGEGTEETIEKAIQYLEEAISREPHFTLALSALADCYATLATEGHAPPKENFEKARKFAAKALELDDTIPEAHATLGLVLEQYHLDFQRAEEEFRRAAGLNPSYGQVCRSFGAHLACMGRLDEAIAEIKRAIQLNPLALNVNECAAVIFNCANQYDEAVEACRRMLELNPNHFPALQFLAETYLNKSMWKEAIDALQKALTISNNAPSVRGRLGYALARSGNESEATIVLRNLIEDSKRTYIPPVAIAMVHCGLGNNEQALEWLNRAYDERPDTLLTIRVRPLWSPLQQDPRFRQLMQRMRLEG